MASGSVIKAPGKEHESISGGGNFIIDMQRIGNLRILTIYNGLGLQTPISIQLANNDIPAFNVQVGNWVAINGNGTFGSRYVSINTTGVLTTSDNVFRGGWVVVYLSNISV